MQDILLSRFNPKSELVLSQHFITKPKYPVFDIHCHLGLIYDFDYANKYDTGKIVRKMQELGVKRFVNLDGRWGDELDRMLEKTRGFEEQIITFGTFDLSNIDDSDFSRTAVDTIRKSHAKGIRGIKMLKDVGLYHKYKDGRYIGIDDKKFMPVWEEAAQLKMPVLVHVADPVAFFKPVDEYNERLKELMEFPHWAFSKPGMNSYQELMDMQEALLYNNPDTTFIIAHVGSASENLKFVSDCLDKYPNMYIDIAARIDELGRQPYSSREFFIKYQDRILFGTDTMPDCIEHDVYYRFLETRDEYFDPSNLRLPSRWRIYGIDLPDDVLKKVYFENAEKLLGV